MRENVYKPLVSQRILKKKNKRVFSQKYCACFFLSKVVEARDKLITLAWKHHSRCRKHELRICQYIFIIHLLLCGLSCEWIDMEMNIPGSCLDICNYAQSPSHVISPHHLPPISSLALLYGTCFQSLPSPLQHLARWNNH